MTNSAPRHRAPRPHARLRRTLVVGAVLVVGVLAVSGGALASSFAVNRSASAPSAVQHASGSVGATPSPSSTTSHEGAAGGLQDPAIPIPSADVSGVTVSRVQIPAIGVDAAVELIDRDATGVLLPPSKWADAGWYRSGVLPGRVGPAIIAGHLDTTLREAVFAHLKQLVAGDRVTVTLSDGSQSTFAVDSAINVEKKTFPTQEVYGPTPDAQLRLITCNGPYDDAAHSYANNYVVFTSLVAPGT